MTSKSSDNFGVAALAALEQPIMDLVTSLMGCLTDACYKRGQLAQKLIDKNNMLTQHAYLQHIDAFIASFKLLVEPDGLN